MKIKNRIALVLLILAIVIAVGTLFYAKKIKKGEKNPSSSTSQTVSSSSSAQSSGQPTISATKVATIWPKYTNSQYGFEMSFSDIWKDYKLTASSTNGSYEAEIDFNLATADTKYEKKIATPISVFVYKPSIFSALADSEKSIEITRDSKYVFSYKVWNEPPSDLQGFTDKELADTIKSFKLK